MKCNRCGKDNPAEIHTCTANAEWLEQECKRLRSDNDWLRAMLVQIKAVLPEYRWSDDVITMIDTAIKGEK